MTNCKIKLGIRLCKLTECTLLRSWYICLREGEDIEVTLCKIIGEQALHILICPQKQLLKTVLQERHFQNFEKYTRKHSWQIEIFL